MLIVIVAALLGIWRYRSIEYFKWVGIAAVWMFVAGVLFYAGGTLEDPTGDGIITHQIRVAANNGPMMGLFAIAFLIVYWGGLIFFISRMVKAARAVREADELAFAEDEYARAENTGRKALETVALLAASVVWIWFAFLEPAQDQQEGMDADIPLQNAPLPSPAGLSVEQEVMGAAAEINAGLPQKIDEVTTLEKATAAGKKLTYHYRIEGTSADRDKLLTFIRSNVVPKACTGSLRPYMRDKGVSYTYSYVGTDFTAPIEVNIDEKMCEGLEDYR
tara:strand:+ start:15164 stop:15991 length:828 start_codon:yes stop_codon:yes gene_type:complete